LRVFGVFLACFSRVSACPIALRLVQVTEVRELEAERREGSRFIPRFLRRGGRGTSAPGTKTCPFTPANRNRLLGTPNPWGLRTWGTRPILPQGEMAHVGSE
jgi:hypothetical protein